VSAVVATFQRRSQLPAFLDALLERTEPDEVVVAIDGSDDGSLEYVESRGADDSRIRALWVDHGGQFVALDAAARAASGDVVLFLDDDVEAGPDLVEGHRRRHAEREHLVVQGYMPVHLEPDPPASRFTTVLYDAEYERRCAGWEADPGSVLRHLWGGNLSMRRADYLDLDYAPLVSPAGAEDVRLYNQDRHLGLCCEESGLTGVFDRRAAGTHLHQRDLAGFARDSFGQGACAVLMHRLHPTLVPDPDAGSSRRARTSRQLASNPRVAAAAASVGSAAVQASVRAGTLRLAIDCARSLRSLQIARGAQRMRQALAGAPAGTS
jgi:glycosyltransferase involved in cell wall biosynthesis